MNNILMTGLCFVVTKLMQGIGSSSGSNEEIAKLKLAAIYLHAVKISRLLFISFLGSGVCLIFLFIGLLLIHGTIWFYAPWDIAVKVTVTLIAAFSYILIAVGIFAYVFAEDKWMKMFNAKAMIQELTTNHA